MIQHIWLQKTHEYTNGQLSSLPMFCHARLFDVPLARPSPLVFEDWSRKEFFQQGKNPIFVNTIAIPSVMAIRDLQFLQQFNVEMAGRSGFYLLK